MKQGRRKQMAGNLLEPIAYTVQHVHRYGVDTGNLLLVVLEHKHHVKILDVELHALKVHQLYFVERDYKRWLQKKMRGKER